MNQIAFHRLFSMSAFEGLRLIRKESYENPGIGLDEILKTLTINPFYATLDIEASLLLNEFVDNKAPFEGVEFYRECISTIIIELFPSWSKIIILGRKRFVQKLGSDDFRDIRSLFRQAGLLDDPPRKADVEWWDFVSGRVRLEGDRKKLERARFAEELSLKFEKIRLLREGITMEPKWMAIDDNTAGYDILSYSQGEYGLINKLIEVKSTTASPLRFYVTRNEWDHAIDIGEAYCFHIWDLQPEKPVLYVKSTDEIALHIPNDNEKGRWTVAEIPISDSKPIRIQHIL